jgi:hypothetical protein
MDQSTLAVEWISIDRLFENPANPRHNDAAVPHVAASLSRFGWRQPIVAKPSGEIVAGHTRYKAAKKLGMDELPVVRFEGSDLDATAYGIADNRTAEFAEWDQPALAGLLEELRSEDALDGVGYTGPDIDALLAEIRAGRDEPLQDPGPGDPPSTPVSRTGDLWCLGTHRLLCGDSTCLEDVRRVIGAEQARLVATDPPYLVDYTGERPMRPTRLQRCANSCFAWGQADELRSRIRRTHPLRNFSRRFSSNGKSSLSVGRRKAGLRAALSPQAIRSTCRLHHRASCISSRKSKEGALQGA